MAEPKMSDTECISFSQIRRKSFHEKYLSICKIKLLQPLKEVKLKQGNFQLLDFHADRIKVNDWLAICSALQNDRTLKFVSIKLRKNDERVLESVDTLKKAKCVTSVPVIYSKFLLTELVDSLQSMLKVNNVLEILSLEGLPFGDRYMMTLVKGLYSNRTIKILNFSRSNIGDEGCEILCSNIKNLSNIEVLNLSNCNLGVKSAESIREFIKFQKIHRFSEAWIRSLRYQDIEPDSFGGLKKLLLNHNPQIGDEGLKILTDELCEDVWIKDIQMQNCGLTDVAANEIINCLNVNKTILSFNVANNIELPDHMYRHIMLRLQGYENDSGDSGDSKVSIKKLTKVQLLDRIKYLEEHLESERYKRKHSEELNDQLKEVIENQKQLEEINAPRQLEVPEGYTLIPNAELARLQTLHKGTITRKSASNIAVRLRRKRKNSVKKVQSFVIESPMHKVRNSQSEACLKNRKIKENKKKAYVESNIGDTLENNFQMIKRVEVPPACDDNEYDEEDLLQMFIKTQTTSSTDFELKTLFNNTYSSRAPNNSEIESDDEY